MPQATDLVVKNGATTPVDKTFSLITNAAGDGSYAQWALKEGAISSAFPIFRAITTQGNRARTLRMRLRVPSAYVDSTNGLTMVGAFSECNVQVSMPQDFPESMKADFVAYATNLVNTALIKSMMRDAIPAT